MAPLIEVRRAIEIGARDRRSVKAAIAASEFEQGPVDQQLLDPRVGPFVVGDGDAAVAAAQDRLDDYRIAERLDIPLALQAGLVGVDAAGDVDRQRERQVDLLPVLRLGRQGGRDQKRNQAKQLGHEDLRARMPKTMQEPYRSSEAAVSRALDGGRRRPLASGDRPDGESPWI